MKFTLQNAIDEVRQLANRVRAREALADELCQKIHSIQAHLLSMRLYQEEIVNLEELASKLGNRPKSPLILCMAAENKQLQQLKMENHALVNSLEEHRAVLDIIMAKYREQVSHLMYTNKVERIIRPEPETSSPRSARTRVSSASKPCPSTTATTGNSTADANNTLQLATQVATLASIAKDVSDKGDAYATELETELFRLRAENAGLRELLDISRAFSVPPADNDTCASDAVEARLLAGQQPTDLVLETNQHSDVEPGHAHSHRPAFGSGGEGEKNDYDHVRTLLLCTASQDRSGGGGGSGQMEDGESSRDLKDSTDDEDTVTVTDNNNVNDDDDDDDDDGMIDMSDPYAHNFHSASST